MDWCGWWGLNSNDCRRAGKAKRARRQATWRARRVAPLPALRSLSAELDAHLPRQAHSAIDPDPVLRVGADLFAAAATARRSRNDHGRRGPRSGGDRADPQAISARSADPGAIR